MDFLSKEEILDINKAIIEQYGGIYTPPYNLRNENSLDYLISFVEDGMVYGQLVYPTIHHRAALYLTHINSSHIFIDGNKRTSLAVTNIFLALNNHRLKDKLSIVTRKEGTKIIPQQSNTDNDSILENFIVQIASGILEYEDVLDFIQKNTKKI